MSSFAAGNRSAARLCVPLCALLIGCGPDASGPAPAVISSEIVSTEPGEIVLADPQVTLTAPNRVRFEVRYRFTRGKPEKHYMCEVSFPGTTNQASKAMSHWELQPEGTIRDGFVLPHPPVEKFEIRVLEADSPQNGYKPISNIVSGTVGKQ